MTKSNKSPVKTAASKVTAPLKKPHSKQKSSAAGGFRQWFQSLGTAHPKKHQSAMMMGGEEQDMWRFVIVWLLMAFLFAALGLKLFWVQLMPATKAVEFGQNQVTAERTLPAHRGLIYDRMGVPLAANAPLHSVYLDSKAYAELYHNYNKKLQSAKTPEQRQKIQEALDAMDLTRIAAIAKYPLEELKKATGLDKKISYHAPDVDQQIEEALPKGAGTRRLALLERVPPEAAQALVDLKISNTLIREVTYQRYYLQAEPNAQVLGYMGRVENANQGMVGRSGLEARYNTWLSGKDGKTLVLKDRFHQPIDEVKVIEPLVEGKDLHLTIDSRLQYVLYKELEQVARVQSARGSSGMVVDVRTGEVLAMASWPSFNSNNLAERNGLNERNQPVLDVFEPGSVMKPFTVAAALDSGKYTTSSLINTSPGSLYVGGYTIKDGGNYGTITLSKLIQKSSNVASSKIALSLPASAIADMQKRFGFGQKTQLNFPAEASGRVQAPSEKELSRRATLSYGYGQQVTLAQLAQAYATLGNQGVMQPLNIVKDVDKGEPVQVISAKHAKDIVAMMELVTQEGGTGRAAAINGYRVAGKTGTSRRTKPTGGYYTDQYRTVFAGLAPASNPRFAVAILVEDPRLQKYAGQVSAPVFRDVMKEALRLYNVPYDKPLYVEN